MLSMQGCPPVNLSLHGGCNTVVFRWPQVGAAGVHEGPLYETSTVIYGVLRPLLRDVGPCSHLYGALRSPLRDDVRNGPLGQACSEWKSGGTINAFDQPSGTDQVHFSMLPLRARLAVRSRPAREEWLGLQDELVVCQWHRRIVENEMAKRPFWTTVGVVASILGALLASLLAWASGGQ